LEALLGWARTHGHADIVRLGERYMETTLTGVEQALPGPTGERNVLSFHARGTVLCAATGSASLLNQVAAAFATGNRVLALVQGSAALPNDWPAIVKDSVRFIGASDLDGSDFAIALVEQGIDGGLQAQLAARPGAIVGIVDTRAGEPVALWRMVAERALCVNTTAAGGNASLMTLSV
jgi:RHH-type proline utilization regulon transcriptional repressor/proline dehydrogenase/delta 1-pyrroline-5-carboxylate dehydrogenase